MSIQNIKRRAANAIHYYGSARYFMVVLVVVAAVGTVITNACINIAIVAMAPSFNENATVTGSCSVFESHVKTKAFEVGDTNLSDAYPGRLRDRVYNWTEGQKSMVYSSFFWSYIVCHAFSGMVVAKLGSRWLIPLCLLGSCVITAGIPFSTDFFAVFLVLRILLGLLHSVVFPATYDVIFNWLPRARERKSSFALVDVGSHLATVTIYISSGSLTMAHGWPSLFFMPAVVAGVSGCLVTLALRNKPIQSVIDNEMSNFSGGEESPGINDCVAFGDTKKTATPFRAVITNRAVLAAALNRFCGSWNFFIIMSKIPIYLKVIEHEDISTNGMINAGMAALAGMSLIMNGMLSDVIVDKGWLSKTRTRKVFSLCSGISTAVCMMSIPAAKCNRAILHVILFLQAYGGGFSAGCDAALPSEMSKNFSAVIFAIVDTIGLSAGTLTPLYAGLILDNIEDQWKAWSVLFWSSGVLIICCMLFFQVFGSAERQPFDFVREGQRSFIPRRPRPRKFSHF